MPARRRTALWSLAGVCLLLGCRTAALRPGKPAVKPNPAAVPVEFHAIRVDRKDPLQLPRYFGVYFGILAHSNGKVYVGTCYHVARLVEFDPQTATMRVVATMSSRARDGGGPHLKYPTLRGDLGTGSYPETRWTYAQDKIHTQLLEGKDGRVYGATHTKVEDPNKTRNYPGGHWFAYDPEAGKTEDLGWVRRHEGIITCCLDTERHVLYGVTWPTGYLVRCRPDEPVAARRHDLLGLACGDLDCSPRYVEVVGDGRVYVPDGATGNIRVFDPRHGPDARPLEILGLTTPPGPDAVRAPYAGTLRATGKWRNWWIVGCRSPDRMHVFFTGQRSGHLAEIDATQGKWGVVIDHGRTVPWATPGWSGPWCGIMCFSRDGLLFHTVGRQLLTYNPKTGHVVDWGRTVLKSDPGVALALGGGGSLGPDGSIYCVARVGRREGVAILNPRPIEARWRRLKSYKEGGAPNLLRVSPRRVMRPLIERQPKN
jgi:hypothetical protein